jgi:FKBP-type peptidyl-prolyl cis-trans isomerase
MRKYFNVAMFLLFGLLISFPGYLAGQDGLKQTSTGLKYQINKVSQDTSKPRTGDWITFNMRYTAKVHGKDTMLFDSKTGLKGEPVRIELPPSDFRGDLYEGIRMLSPGDSGMFAIDSDSLFLKTFRMPKRPEMIDSNTAICFYIHLISADSRDKLEKTEGILLQKYISDNQITVQPTASGIYIVKSVESKEMKIDTGCQVKLQFVVSLIDGKQIFSSLERPEPIKIQYGQKFDTPGMQEAVGAMKKGEKAKIIVPSKMAFGEKGRGSLVPPYATLIYDVEIVDAMSKADAEKEQAAEKQKTEEKNNAIKQDETAQLDKYLKEKNITVKPTASGLYFIEKEKGTGTQAVAGKTVKVHYTGTLLNGKKFDSSVDRGEPFEFSLGKGQVIQGWDEGIALMKVGGKATLIIPSKIGYGERSMGEIPPYSTLVFDVELIEVK